MTDPTTTTSTNSFKTSQFTIDPHRQIKQLSESQQERLLQYFEDQFLNVQRRFVSRLNPPNGYKDIKELLSDVDKIVNVIWYSIVSSEPKRESEATDTDKEVKDSDGDIDLEVDNDDDDEEENDNGNNNDYDENSNQKQPETKLDDGPPIVLFGQTHHLLTLADRLITYSEATAPNQQTNNDLHTNDFVDSNGFGSGNTNANSNDNDEANTNSDSGGFSAKPAPKQTLQLLDKLDTIFQILLQRNLLTRTETVRLESIAERSRVEFVNIFENVDVYSDEEEGDGDNNEDGDDYQFEIGKLYEKTLSCII